MYTLADDIAKRGLTEFENWLLIFVRRLRLFRRVISRVGVQWQSRLRYLNFFFRV